MRATFGAVLVSIGMNILALWCSGEECQQVVSRKVFEAGHDEVGYFVRALPVAGRDYVFAENSIQELGDYLAAEQHATVIYDVLGTKRNVARGEWRGKDPLSTLRAFGSVAGLEVVVPEEGFWVIGAKGALAIGGIAVLTYPIDSSQQDRMSPARRWSSRRSLCGSFRFEATPIRLMTAWGCNAWMSATTGCPRSRTRSSCPSMARTTPTTVGLPTPSSRSRSREAEARSPFTVFGGRVAIRSRDRSSLVLSKTSMATAFGTTWLRGSVPVARRTF